MRTLNLGILAHVDAGKTTLTERLLFMAGVIERVGSVDAGDTQTDTLALERRRGITIRSAVVSFEMNGVTINLIDTPGHPDFIAEVERVLAVLDGAVLVISAVEGVQAQTRVLLRTLRRLNVPTLLFVNKADRAGARYGGLLQEIHDRLTPAAVPMSTVQALGTREVTVHPCRWVDTTFLTRLTEVLSDNDDAVLQAYVERSDLTPRRLRRELTVQTGAALVHPTYFGSAVTGAGLEQLIGGITEFLPRGHGDPTSAVSGTVFKIDRGQGGEKIAYVRMFSGTLRLRDTAPLARGESGKVTGIGVFDHGRVVRRNAVAAGEIAQLSGLGAVRIGDCIGIPHGRAERHFAAPSLETAVVPTGKSGKGELHVALSQLAEQDPLIDLRQDDVRQEIYVSLYGEVQKEVIQATLALDYGIEAAFRDTTPICIERPVRSGHAVEVLGKNENPFTATVELRVDRAPAGSGVEFRMCAHPYGIPIHVYKTVEAFTAAIERAVRTTLQQGIHGWQVTDCVVTLMRSGFTPATAPRDFRLLTPLVLMDALQRAGTVVCEPIHRFRLEIPADCLGTVLPVLSKLRATPDVPSIDGGACTMTGHVPVSQVHALRTQLPGVTRGEGVLESTLDHYEPMTGSGPERARTDGNPLDRREYLRHVLRHM